MFVVQQLERLQYQLNERAFDYHSIFYDKCDTDEERKKIDDKYFWLVDHLRENIERHIRMALATPSSVM